MINVFIAEDEKHTLSTIRNIVENYCTDATIVGIAENVNDSVIFLNENKIDLALLDINYPDGTGFDILQKINKRDFKVIFITAFEEYALRAIKFSAVDYLLKPINPEELIEAVQKINIGPEIDQLSMININTLLSNISGDFNKNKKLVLKTQKRVNVVEINDIIRCESDGAYTTFFMIDAKKILVSKNLSEYEELLKDYQFIRTHKSHLVNLDYITSYEKTGGGFLKMKDNSEVPVSVRKKDMVLKKISQL